MYKVYLNGLLNSLTRHSCALSLNNIRFSSLSFADDISLLALHLTFFSTFMKMCCYYSIKWRYEFSHIKTGVVTFGETKCVHCEAMKERSWILGNESVNEIYEYKNLGVVRNCIGSFSSDVDENIEKPRKNAGMIFSSNFDRRKVNLLIYIKFWRQARLPSLLYGSELFNRTPNFTSKA